MRILVLTNNAYQVATLPEALELLGHQVHCVKHGAVAVQWLETHRIEAIIISWDLPVAVVCELLRWIRLSQGARVELLFWTGSILDVNLFMALRQEQDVTVARSPRVLELAAKLNIVLRRPQEVGGASVLRLGAYALNFVERTVLLDERATALTATEFEMAALLFKNPGQALTRRHIRSIIWGEDDRTSSRSLDTHMSRIRSKLELTGAHGIKLTAIYARGYRLDTVAVAAPGGSVGLGLAERVAGAALLAAPEAA